MSWGMAIFFPCILEGGGALFFSPIDFAEPLLPPPAINNKLSPLLFIIQWLNLKGFTEITPLACSLYISDFFFFFGVGVGVGGKNVTGHIVLKKKKKKKKKHALGLR